MSMEGLDFLGAVSSPRAPASRVAPRHGVAEKRPDAKADPAAASAVAKAKKSAARAIAAGQKAIAASKRTKNKKLAAKQLAKGQAALKAGQDLTTKASTVVVGYGELAAPGTVPWLINLLTQVDQAAQEAEDAAAAGDYDFSQDDVATAIKDATDQGNRAITTGQKALAAASTMAPAAQKKVAAAGAYARRAGNDALAAIRDPRLAVYRDAQNYVSGYLGDAASDGMDAMNALRAAARTAAGAADAADNAVRAAQASGGTTAPATPVNVQGLIGAAQSALAQVQYATQAAVSQQNQVAFSQLQTIAQQLQTDINAGQPYLANPAAATATWATQIATDTNNATSALVMLQQGGMGAPGMSSGGFGGSGGGGGGGSGGESYGGGGEDEGDYEGEDVAQEVVEADEEARGEGYIPPSEPPEESADVDYVDAGAGDEEQGIIDEDAGADLVGFDWLDLASGGAGLLQSFGGAASGSGGKSESDKLAALLAKQKADEDLRRAQEQASTLKTAVVGVLVFIGGAALYVFGRKKR